MISICLVDISAVIKKGIAKNVTAWPANSSATTSPGSDLPVAAIAAGAKTTQITEPASAKAAIVIDISPDDTPKRHISAKITAGGSEPHVPGQRGSRPRPKHDVNILFIFAED